MTDALFPCSFMVNDHQRAGKYLGKLEFDERRRNQPRFVVRSGRLPVTFEQTGFAIMSSLVDASARFTKDWRKFLLSGAFEDGSAKQSKKKQKTSEKVFDDTPEKRW